MICGAFTNELTRTISSQQEQRLTLMNAPRTDLGYEIKYEAETRSIPWLACPLPPGSRATLTMLRGEERQRE